MKKHRTTNNCHNSFYYKYCTYVSGVESLPCASGWHGFIICNQGKGDTINIQQMAHSNSNGNGSNSNNSNGPLLSLFPNNILINMKWLQLCSQFSFLACMKYIYSIRKHDFSYFVHSCLQLNNYCVINTVEE